MSRKIKMGGMCDRPQPIEVPSELKRRYSKECDMIITPASFVKENLGVFYEYYRLESNPLGSGAWGQVRKCVHKATNDLRVVKIISKADLPKSMIESRSAFHEAEILKTLDHPNLPRIYEFFEDASNYFIVLEYCRGGDLFDRIIELKSFTESQAAKIIQQILLAVNYLHSKGIVHRDIKPENVLMSNQESLSLKVIDFDTATMYRNVNFKCMYGTPLYMAPEVVKGRYNEKCDLWSCGMILYILLSGGPPFNGTDDEIFAILRRVKIDLTGPLWSSLSVEAVDLLGRLLDTDPNKRISAADACQHPWFKKFEQEIEDGDVLDILSNIQKFTKTSKLKEAIHTFIISKVVDPSIFKKEQAVFHLLDLNSDGTVSEEELVALMMSKKMPEDTARRLAAHIIEQADADKSGFIDYTEFLRAAVAKDRVLTKENILHAFRIFDSDGSGSIECEELRSLFSDGANATEQLISGIIAQADRSGDGTINLHEFEALLMENITRRGSRSMELSPVRID